MQKKLFYTCTGCGEQFRLYIRKTHIDVPRKCDDCKRAVTKARLARQKEENDET